MKNLLLVIVNIFMVFSLSIAQKTISKQHLIWTRYDVQLKLGDQWTIQEEIEDRAYYIPWKQHQFIARTQILYKFHQNWTTGLGFSYFLQSLPQDPYIKEIEHKTELRPHLALSNKFKINEKFSIDNRYWSEFRIFEESKGKFTYGNVRLRYHVKLNYQALKKLQVSIFNEVHINIGKKINYNIFDQNRIGLSVNYYPIKNLGLELSYFHWYQQRASGVDFYSRHILRFTVHHIIKVKKIKKTKSP